MPKRPSVQNHHISYEPEITVRIFRGEHLILTRLNRQTKNVSAAFISELKKWIKKMEDKAVDL